MSPAENSSAYSGHYISYRSSDMSDGTCSLRKNRPGATPYSGKLLGTSEVNRLPWTQEIEGKIILFNEPVEEFLDVFVPGPRPSKQLFEKNPMDAFKAVNLNGKRGEELPRLISGLRSLVQEFEAERKPTFAQGSRCRVPFSLEAWDQDRQYTMPGIIMSLPGNTDAKWAHTWPGVSTVFEVKADASEDPFDEDSDSATIRTDALPTYGLIQISKSARNLLHTHQLLHAYVVGIYGDKARIYRFDHAAGVVSKAIDLKKDPYPLYNFLWRFCHCEHGGQPASSSPQVVTAGSKQPLTRSNTEPFRVVKQQRTAELRVFLGMDPTIAVASEADCDKIDELLQTSSPPQKRLTKDERKSCRWVAVVTEYNPDGSAKTTKRYIMYRVRFLTPRLFSCATTVSDAYEAETWERRTIKDAWRQLTRDREDVLYDQLRDALRQRNDLEKLVEECRNFGLSYDNLNSTTDGSDSPSDAPLASSVADKASINELNDEGDPVLADELPAVNDGPLYGLPDVDVGDDLGACEARKLFSKRNANTSSLSEAQLNSLALGDSEEGGPPVYEVYHRTICASLQKNRKRANIKERSHM
ncbi:hypothetical protein FOMPIDRAFT_1052478 [Fomitopsis schrenkii]|uniref:Fungal-type protein kinase domain-containing protein n=1 Tax=Fomitopsis schrenkii TaxID=2126942 RepID=S8DVU8_FOMSC|nr:hypothetical protein FOMPIDRAFT_1052478 [Fomitopsis schrenkii]